MIPNHSSPRLATLLPFLDRPEHGLDEIRKRLYMALCAAVGVPLLTGFFVWDLSLGLFQIAVLDFGAALVLLLVFFAIRSGRSTLLASRLTVALLALLLLFNLSRAPGNTSLLFWFFIFPLITFFILGRREGLYWNGAIVACAVLHVWLVGLFGVEDYALEIKVRLPAALVIATIFTYGYERFRERAQQRAEKETLLLQVEHGRLLEAQSALEAAYGELQEANSQLEAEIEQRRLAERDRGSLIEELRTAAEEVRQLSGLLPICASCKKIRDDQGYWEQLEEYFLRHSELVFSHCICPDCLESLYPEERPVGE